MTARDHRPKASEIYGKSELVFAKKAPFDEAFPEISDIRIEIDEYGYGTEHYLTAPTKNIYGKCLGEYVDCSNPRCYAGGVSIGNIIRQMVQERKETSETSAICKGNEASPKGRVIRRKCLNSFVIRVRLSYKDGVL